MIEIRKEWKHKSLAKADLEQMVCPINQLMWCIPEEKTEEEQELYDALQVIQKYVGKIK